MNADPFLNERMQVKCPCCGEVGFVAELDGSAFECPTCNRTAVPVVVPTAKLRKPSVAGPVAVAVLIGLGLLIHWMDGGDGLREVLIYSASGLFAGFLYVAPWYQAIEKRHAHAVQIGTLNVLLGWTVLGWIAALIWSQFNVRRA